MEEKTRHNCKVRVLLKMQSRADCKKGILEEGCEKSRVQWPEKRMNGE